VYGPDRTSTGGGQSGGRDGPRNARYAYLLARLQNRQMTMEEATELFTIMQGMLQTSEAARLALARATTPPPTAPGQPPPPPRIPSQPTGTGDDLFLVTLLAMGAGAGLLAAMTKRVQDVTAPAPAPSSSRPNSGTSSQKG